MNQLSEKQIGVARRDRVSAIVRPAAEGDVQAISDIVGEYARQGHLLPRSAESIRSSLPSWFVAEVDGKVVGCGSLMKMGPALVEVRSLAVLPAYQRYGVGAQIVQQLVEQARQDGYPTIFALTRAVTFFEHLGFTITSKERFPEKVWRDCAICPLQERCDETAVAIDLAERDGVT